MQLQREPTYPVGQMTGTLLSCCQALGVPGLTHVSFFLIFILPYPPLPASLPPSPFSYLPLILPPSPLLSLLPMSGNLLKKKKKSTKGKETAKQVGYWPCRQ